MSKGTRSGSVGELPALKYQNVVYPTTNSSRRNNRHGGIRSLETPLASYVATRHRTRALWRHHTTPRETKTSLLNLASPEANPGFIGGNFKSATMVTSIAHPTLHNKFQVTQNGVRKVRVHSDRYTPVTGSELLYNWRRPSESNEIQQLRGERELEIVRARRTSTAHVGHRMDFNFYMSGHSAPLARKGELSPEDRQRLLQNSLSQNQALYYGRGVGNTTTRPASRAVRQFQKKLQLVEDEEQEHRPELHTPVPSLNQPVNPDTNESYSESVFITEGIS